MMLFVRMMSSLKMMCCLVVWLSLDGVGYGTQQTHTMPVTGQQACANGMRIEGVVTDPSGAIVPGAVVRAFDGQSATTDAAGAFLLGCVRADLASLTVEAAGFAPSTTRVNGAAGSVVHISLRLTIAAAEASIEVRADGPTQDLESGAGTTALNAADVLRLPDDPDDLLQQLQLLAASSGGGTATVVVDGFQNGSAMPPKSSIAAVRINPDPVAPEYEQPGMDDGRIEITTKPGSDKYHGALFLTDSDASFNATDPFSTSSTPAGKRKYGFEFGGPIQAKKSGFFMALERRNIDEFNVVNAITLDANQKQVAEHDTVAAPQRLWIGSARVDWQPSEKEIVALSYAANVNELGNQGVGGQTLPEAGYASRVAEYDLRLSSTWMANPNLVHETRVGYTWKRTEQMPNSTDAALQVAGYFNGGGATSQHLNNRERDLEIDDDVLITRGNHSIKFGAQSLGLFVHDYDPDTFNGAFQFGGGSAPVLDANNNPTGATETITPIEQYRRALLGLPGSTPTTYQVTTGTALVPFTQWKLGLYAQDSMKLMPRLTVMAGLRYNLETSPGTFANFGPRLGVAWSPDKASKWSLRMRTSIFSLPLDRTYATAAYRLNGVRQKQAIVYSPEYADPLAPVAGSIQVATQWRLSPHMQQVPVALFAAGVENDLPYHWHWSVWYTRLGAWGDTRAVNVNAPVVAASSGVPVDPVTALMAPRPGAADLNIFEYQSSAHNRGGIFWAGLEQKGYKRWTLSLGYWNTSMRTDGNTPQSSYSSRGEAARPNWQSSGALLQNDLKLPFKFELSTQAYWHYGMPYNITTGTDANGDGSFNDRPAYAAVAGDGVYSTPFGLMTSNAVNGDVPRNLGTMPVVMHAYSNLSRVFALGGASDPNGPGGHPRTLTLNVRAANLINHTNVTAVGTVVSSPSLGESLAAEAARRVELGARFAF